MAAWNLAWKNIAACGWFKGSYVLEAFCLEGHCIEEKAKPLSSLLLIERRAFRAYVWWNRFLRLRLVPLRTKRAPEGEIEGG